MKLAIAKWGHSAALRLPQTLLKQLSVQIGGDLNATLEDGRLVLEPSSPDLLELLQGITPENRHSELISGKAGNELI